MWQEEHGGENCLWCSGHYEKHGSKDPVTVLEQAVKNATPQLEVKPRRVGGATYQVPVEVRPDRGLVSGYALAGKLSQSQRRQIYGGEAGG